MTPNNHTAELVTQADRDAAAAHGEEMGWNVCGDIRSGKLDYWPIVQAFARHRIASEQATVERCAKVADGHDEYTPTVGDVSKGYKLACADIARSIRSLSHTKGNDDVTS